MTLSTQFLTMLTMIGMGSFFGAALDTYNRFLKRAKRKHWLVFVNDLLFWLLQALIIFYVLFIVNEGELRFYIFIALLCGFAAYQSLFKQVYLKALEKMISIVLAVWRFLVNIFLHLIYKPILSLVTFLISVFIMLGRGLLALILFIGRLLLGAVKLFWSPIKVILLLFRNLLPKRIKKFFEKIYNKKEGFLKRIKKYVSNKLNQWKNHTK